jgi:hypothetical protein
MPLNAFIGFDNLRLDVVHFKAIRIRRHPAGPDIIEENNYNVRPLGGRRKGTECSANNGKQTFHFKIGIRGPKNLRQYASERIVNQELQKP